MATLLSLHTARRARQLRAFDPRDVRPLIDGAGRFMWVVGALFVILLCLSVWKALAVP